MEKSKNYRLKFVKYNKGDFVQYLIRLVCIDDTSINVEFLERYSTLKDLHESFRKDANSINFPKFPPKKFFGSTDEKFLNQRMTALEHYFGTLLGSKEFANLATLKKWVDGLIKKYNKNSAGDSTKVSSKDEKNDKNQQKVMRSDSGTPSNQNPNTTTILKSGDSILKCKDVVDKYSKNFIDLNNYNNPNYEIEDSINKEKHYKNLLKTSNTFEVSQSKFFKLVPGDNTHFECLGLEEPKVAAQESGLLSKLNSVSKYIAAEIPEEYMVENLIVKVDISRN